MRCGSKLVDGGTDALFEDANPAAAYEFFDVVDEEAVGGDGDVVRFRDSAELADLSFIFIWE